MNKRLRDLEARDNWIEARIDELMADWSFTKKSKIEWSNTDTALSCMNYVSEKAAEQATREHAEIEAMILDAQIDNLELR